MTGHRRLLLALAAAVAVWLGVLEVAGADALLLHLLPALLLAVPLLLGRYPGERLIRRALGRGTRPRGTGPARPLAGWPSLLPRGGRLLACGLAGRAPPRCLAVTHHR